MKSNVLRFPEQHKPIQPGPKILGGIRFTLDSTYSVAIEYVGNMCLPFWAAFWHTDSIGAKCVDYFPLFIDFFQGSYYLCCEFPDVSAMPTKGVAIRVESLKESIQQEFFAAYRWECEHKQESFIETLYQAGVIGI
jgi:hypothetical protein